jgi:RHS repeat-associated protein
MTYAYEADRRRLQTLTAKTAATRLVMDNGYTYDREENILSIVNNAPIPNPNLMGGRSNYQYAYDDLYRLTNANGKFMGATHEQRYSLSMGYDNLSSITSKGQVHEKKANGASNWVLQNKTSYSYTYNYDPGGKPHAAMHVGDKAYSYDANGNQTGWNHDVNAQNRQIAWDEENRVKTLSDNGQLFRYTYDGTNERVLKSNGNGQTVNVNGKPAGQTGGIGNYTIYVNPYMDVRSGGFTKHFYTEEGKIVSKLGESGRSSGGNGNGGGGNGNNQEAFQFYYHTDHLGNTAFITDRLGEVYQHLEYFPFGETFVEEKSNTWRTPYLYNAKELDDETGLYYYGARYYDTKTSIWQSSDPLAEEFPSLSPYCYVANNPINFVDPNGEAKGKSTSTGPSTASLLKLKAARQAARKSAAAAPKKVIAKPKKPRLVRTYIMTIKKIGTGSATSDKTRKLANSKPKNDFDVYGESYEYQSDNGKWKTRSFISLNPHLPGEILDAGHIEGDQLGGSGTDPNNIFGQNIALNRWKSAVSRVPVGINSHSSKYTGKTLTWREWEDKKRRKIEKYKLNITVKFWAD